MSLPLEGLYDVLLVKLNLGRLEAIETVTVSERKDELVYTLRSSAVVSSVSELPANPLFVSELTDIFLGHTKFGEPETVKKIADLRKYVYLLFSFVFPLVFLCDHVFSCLQCACVACG